MSETVNDYGDLLDGAEHRWRNRLIGLVVLAALLAAGAYALWAMVLGGGGSSAAEVQTATVERGSISKTVSTSGSVVAQSTANLSFSQSGTVSAVNVTLGQEVKQGDVLAEIESDTLQNAIMTAELNLASAQVKLSQLLEGSSESELASADQSLAQAQASFDKANRALQDLMSGPSASDVLSAEQAVSSAQSQLAKAEDSRAKVYSASDDAIAAAEDAVKKAESALENAKGTASNAANNLKSAKAKLESTETGYCSADCDDGLSFCKNRAAPISSADEASLDEVTAAGTPECASQAASVLGANTSYQSARSSKNSADDAVVSAQADVEAAQNDLQEAKKGPSSEEIAAADVAVTSAQLSLDAANAKLVEVNQGATQSELEAAQSDVDMASVALTVAKAKRDEVYAGTDPQDIELQRGQVRQAELAVDKARKDLGKAQLIAPFDGTVATLNIEVGEEVSAGGTTAAIVLNTPDALLLDLAISESDVLNVKVDQSGIATFDAIGETPFPFVIDSVGTNPTTTQGVITYKAQARMLSGLAVSAGGARPGGAARSSATPQAGTLAPEATPPAGAGVPFGGVDTGVKPLPGMNASVTITVDQAQDVLTIPAQAIQTEGFRSVVGVQKDDGSTENVVVQTGLTDGTNTEITEGLEEGQTIIIPSRAATSAQATQVAGFQQGGFREGQLPEGGGPSFQIGPGGSAP